MTSSTIELNEVVALATFVAIGSGSPGPNNTLLLASGVNFGFRRTLPHVAGTTLGIALLVGIAAAGAGAVVTAVPGVQLTLKVLASGYLIFLAVRLAGGFSLGRASVPEPFTLMKAVTFQFINPKGWFFAFALVGVFSEVRGSVMVEGGILLGLVASIVTASAIVWSLGGSGLSRALESDRRRRIAGWALGAMLAGSVAFFWI